ncbi:MAG: sulfite exporter TauE/SafE family protein [Notoacmeibacter sp.]
MDIKITSLLFGAGVLGGLINAIAGGATLITFPAMLAAGLPAIVANASNAVAVMPGHLVAAIADRDKLPAVNRRFLGVLMASLIGGGLGAGLLLITPERLFILLVPALIAFATLTFAFGKRIQHALPLAATERTSTRSGLVAATSTYGGYFGAGLGVMLLAVLTVTGQEDLRAANVLKNLLATAVSLTTVIIFTISGYISWPETVTMLIGALLGGLLGAKLIAVLPASIVRILIIATGCIMAVTYAFRFWF